MGKFFYEDHRIRPVNRRLPAETAHLKNYYINKAQFVSKITSSQKAIENAYKGFLMQHKFPFVSSDGNDGK